MTLFGNMNSTSSYETAKELFSYLDKNQKGYIALDEIAQLCDVNEEFTQSQLYSVFSVLDKTGQGKITLQDFTEAFLASGEEFSNNTDINTEERSAVSPAIDCPKRRQSKQELNSSDTVGILLNSSRLAGLEGNTHIKPGATASHNTGNISIDVTNSDDVFEGDGLLSFDSPILSVSPSRSPVKAPVTRSPSLRRRQTSRNQIASNNEKDEEVRLPPDGIEGDPTRTSPKSSSTSNKKDNRNKRKSHKNVDNVSRGFAKDAISDILKIVDSHTLSNLGVYSNKNDGVWRHDVNWNVSNYIENNDLSDERRCPPWLRASMDWTEDHDGTNGTLRSESRESGLNDSGSEVTSVASRFEDNDCDYNNSDSITNGSSSHLEQLEEEEIDPMCGISNCNAKNSIAGDDCSHDHADPDFNEVSHSQLPNNPDTGANKKQVGATVDKNVVGNLIFDMNHGNHNGLYDRILSYSGVELNSRLSSSETSLHELLLEAEAVRNNSFHMEDWDTVMKRINGVALFGGNQTVRYLWQQLSIYNTDLIQPFEDFLKTMVTEIQRAYTKCQELDLALNSKTDQHEREMARIYDEMEQLLSREKDQLQEKHTEREDHQRCEFNRIIEIKENEFQEVLRSKADVEAKLEAALEDCHVLKTGKERIDKHLAKSILAESQQRQENEDLLQENRLLYRKLEKANREYNEIQEHLVKMTKIAETNKENYQRCLQQFQDALEEREYFDVNISNLTQELQDLRNANNVLQERFDTSLTSHIHWRDEQMAPKSPKDKRNIDSLDASFKSDKSPKTQQRKSSKVFAIQNGSAPSSKRSSLVSEPSFEEKTHYITPKLASTPMKIPKPMPVIATGNEYKVIFVGDAGVGKSSLIRKICKGTFRSQRVTTSDPDCQKKIVTVGNRSLTLNLWDTVGQERSTYILKAEGFNDKLIFRFNSLPPSYFRKADVVVLVYDLIEEVSFISIKSWMKTIYEHTDENVLLVLCGNKTDLDHRRQVKEDKALKLAKSNDAIFLETSAKNGYNVAKMCETIAGTLMERDDTVLIREESVKIFDQEYLNISRTKITKCC